MANLSPAITFQVDIINRSNLNSNLPDTFADTISQQGVATIWIEGVPQALKQGDIFTLYGKEAVRIKQLYIDGNLGMLKLYTAPKVIYIFTNDNYVDYVREPGDSVSHEVNNLIASLGTFEITPIKFRGISAASWTAVAEAADVILIPELEENDLDPDLSSDSKTIIRNFVSNGGTFVMFEPESGDLITVLNDIFSFSLDTNNADEPFTLTTDGRTLFPGLSPTLPDNNGSDALDTTTLPAGSTTIYSGDGSNESIVTLMPYGSGKIYVMAWDWYDAAPIGEQDGGWNSVLQQIII